MANKAEPLDVQDLIGYCRGAVAVLRALQISNSTMSYGDFARAIGLLDGTDAQWRPWHRRQIGDILYAVGALEKKARKGAQLEYNRIVSAATGRPGQGLGKVSRIVTK
jgi:hypothetical protein